MTPVEIALLAAATTVGAGAGCLATKALQKSDSGSVPPGNGRRPWLPPPTPWEREGRGGPDLLHGLDHDLNSRE
jgi:hypothetical protein